MQRTRRRTSSVHPPYTPTHPYAPITPLTPPSPPHPTLTRPQGTRRKISRPSLWTRRAWTTRPAACCSRRALSRGRIIPRGCSISSRRSARCPRARTPVCSTSSSSWRGQSTRACADRPRCTCLWLLPTPTTAPGGGRAFVLRLLCLLHLLCSVRHCVHSPPTCYV